MVNESRMVVCDLGNPMVAGTEVSSDQSTNMYTHTPRNDCSYSGLIYTDWWFIMIADHHLCAHYTHSLDYAAPSVSMYMYTSVCAVCNGNPFSSWIADTCRKSRLCKVKSGPFLHEILPCWYVFVWYDACVVCFTACVCVHVYTWHGIVCILLWRRLGRHRGAFGGDMRHSAESIMWFCFTVGGAEQNKGARKECVCACSCVLPSCPDVSHIYLSTFGNLWAYADHISTYPLLTCVLCAAQQLSWMEFICCPKKQLIRSTIVERMPVMASAALSMPLFFL